MYNSARDCKGGIAVKETIMEIITVAQMFNQAVEKIYNPHS